jgi:hypothetical protein
MFRRHSIILYAKRVTWSNFYTENPYYYRPPPKIFHRCDLAPGIWAPIYFKGSEVLRIIGLDPLIVEFSPSHSDTPHTVRLLWTSDRLVAEISTWQHIQNLQETDIHPSAGTRTLNLNKRAAVDPDLRPRDPGLAFVPQCSSLLYFPKNMYAVLY